MVCIVKLSVLTLGMAVGGADALMMTPTMTPRVATTRTAVSYSPRTAEPEML